jgi:hypothetical protein
LGVGNVGLGTPCTPNCKVCPDRNTTVCTVCMNGFGITANLTCGMCPPNCTKCAFAGICDPDGCPGGTPPNAEGQCVSGCAPNCTNCTVAGPGKCDPGGCPIGTTPNTQGICEACAPNCTKCDTAGPGKCDPNGCPAGTTYSGGTCQGCAPNCIKCDTAGPGKCDPDGCPGGTPPNAAGQCEGGASTTGSGSGDGGLSDSEKAGIIIGVIVGFLALLFLLLLLWFCCRRRFVQPPPHVHYIPTSPYYVANRTNAPWNYGQARPPPVRSNASLPNQGYTCYRT